MTALNKQALRVPERKRRDWSRAVMRDCDFCSQWSLTIHHKDGGCICASCCDAEYTSELKGALETAIDLAEAAEKRIAELEARTVMLPTPYPKGYGLAADKYNFALEECADALRAAGIGVKGE
ncbi:MULTISPECIES: small VCP/p97-interacting protein [Citrobacter freundii complex]|uniref:small VCP/p97-interacting protein n=1 Tax=Citrobacter freundii complex TaxID=1344959 RepID=UPI0009CA9224|nr:small VCP/p97-interacting protein [Citrobacter portucalensis]OPX48813.1 hypothetical protein B5P53_21630 [Citrobacter portucalensis]HCB2577810.1 hypothetical protein [Citrobacter freundii]